MVGDGDGVSAMAIVVDHCPCTVVASCRCGLLQRRRSSDADIGQVCVPVQYRNTSHAACGLLRPAPRTGRSR
ncbi:hypothetical protein NC00_12265 [Xanthomonas cannabis pv. phaseoli]|uniref:Uncharacterized protein n=1 Tax=Xanthomonas cannabis pv. phaseoli TaxID=1885902 RepID=A0AB34P745_9XANT|nr:hypothetical protein NC00_12265 [Xanthomonas cannabis pv. phaseoli]